MTQLSLQIDNNTMTKINKAAKFEHLSISKYITKVLKQSFEDKYPNNFTSLFGSIANSSLNIENQKFTDDINRESF